MNIFARIAARLGLLCALLVIGVSGQAQQQNQTQSQNQAAQAPSQSTDTTLQQFEVELIVFRQLHSTASPEDWALEEQRARSSLPSTVDTEEPATAAPAVPATGLESTMQPLESSHFRMAAVEASLRRSSKYAVIAHIGWTQPGFPLDQPRPLALENLVSSDPGLTGTVTLTRGKYLHLLLDLMWHSPDDNRNYVLREQRRMPKSGEMHYLDHPYFGVIALVTPKPQPQP